MRKIEIRVEEPDGRSWSLWLHRKAISDAEVVEEVERAVADLHPRLYDARWLAWDDLPVIRGAFARCEPLPRFSRFARRASSRGRVALPPLTVGTAVRRAMHARASA